MKKIKITPEQYKMLVNESSPVKGGINRMDKLFTKAVKDADIVDLSEYSQFDIKKSIPNVPNSKMKKNKEIEEPIQENIFSPEFHQAIQNFIENIWTNPSQKGLDRVFVENGITWGDIVTYLTSIGILAGIGGGMYKVKNFFGRKFSNDQATKMKEKQEEIEKITRMVEKDPEAPWNQETPYEKKQRMQAKPDSGWEAKPKPFNANRFKPGLEETEEDEYRYDYYNDLGKRGKEPERYRSKSPKVFKPIHMNYDILLAEGPDGLYVFYYEDIEDEISDNSGYELDINDLVDYLNDNYTMMKKGEGVDAWEGGEAQLIKVDDNLKELLASLYSKDNKLINILQSLSEMTSSSSSGAFVGPMGDASAKKNITRGYTPATQINKIINDEDKIYGEKIEEDTLEEMTTAVSSGSYVQPAIWAKDDANWAASKRTQYPGGEMVKFDPCTRLNNNKGAQSGKCSQGAVDKVVKTYKTKDSVISKSMYETIAKKTGRSIDDVKNIIESRLNNKSLS
jgi:hypothetical protein